MNSVLGQEAKPADKDKSPPKPRLVELSLQPVAAPVPALRYLLLPDPVNQTPGNAEPLLNIAGDMINQGEDAGKNLDKIHEWLEMPVEEVPCEEAQKLLDTYYKNALRYAKLASRREWCQWDFSCRTEGFEALLVPLAPQRNIARLLVLQIRLDISEGRFDEALENLQTGFGMARHIGNGPTLIQSLVGAAIANMMSKQIEYWVDTSESPNLYWALTDLPKPLIDARQGLQMERTVLHWEFPQLLDMKNRVMTEKEVNSLVNEMVNQLLSWSDGEESREEEQRRYDKLFSDDKRINEIYGQAKKHLISRGCASKLVEVMPVKQAVMIYSFDRHVYWQNELYKWHGLPYYQVFPGLDDVEGRFGRIRKDLAEGAPFNEYIPSFKRACFILARMDREIAALRCIEAIRMYAADHDGKLPAGLDDITQVPIPLVDPVTGKAFVYRLEGNTAILESMLTKRDDSVQYRLTIAK
jgi:hypothetical protein